MNCRNFLRTAALSSAAFAFIAFSTSANAQKKYDTGASDTEIKIGNIIPYSGPASAYGIIGKMEEAYFKMINDQGGINGRKINFISYDDAYSPPKAVEQARKLVESDEVLFIFGPLGTPSNTAIQKYMNAKKVPQLFVATGATKFGDYKAFPWTMGWQPAYQSEGQIFAKYILTEKPQGKIAVMYQNDDLGKDLLKGLKDGLGDKSSSLIVLEESYEVSEPTIENHVVKAKASGADIFVSISTPKFAAQAIKKVGELGWKPMYFQSNVGASVASVMRPAGIDNSQGVMSLAYVKEASDPQWASDEGMKKYLDFLAKHAPFANVADSSAEYGYGQAQTVVQVLKQAGDDLTRDNIMKQAANLKDFVPDTMLPGVKINTSPTDFYPIQQLRLMRFTGEKWDVFGPPVDSKLGG
jgi:branched-chain amino acid transport system substrate-binding protein